jgi:hypothetical protein
MNRILVAAAFLLALGSQAGAQNLRVTETWYGLYTVEGVQTVEDPRSPSGKRRVGGRIVEPKQNSTRIPHTPGSYFGFGYVLSSPSGASTAQVRHVTLIPPPGLVDNSGRAHTRLESDLNLRVGGDLFIGVSMGERTAIGTWTMQVWHEGRVLIERKFELYRP